MTKQTCAPECKLVPQSNESMKIAINWHTIAKAPFLFWERCMHTMCERGEFYTKLSYCLFLSTVFSTCKVVTRRKVCGGACLCWWLPVWRWLQASMGSAQPHWASPNSAKANMSAHSWIIDKNFLVRLARYVPHVMTWQIGAEFYFRSMFFLACKNGLGKCNQDKFQEQNIYACATLCKFEQHKFHFCALCQFANLLSMHDQGLN